MVDKSSLIILCVTSKKKSVVNTMDEELLGVYIVESNDRYNLYQSINIAVIQRQIGRKKVYLCSLYPPLEDHLSLLQ